MWIGSSSGGICAFTVAWQRPDEFRKVVSYIGSFTSIAYRPPQDGQPLPAVPDAVSKGTVDGFLLPWEVMPSLKLHEMVKFHTETEEGKPAVYAATFVFIMNQAKYDALSPELKKVIDNNSGAALSQQIGKVWDGSQAAGRKAAQDRGNTFYMLPAAEYDNWVKASAGLYDEWTADMDKRGQNGKAMLQEARDLLAKYAVKK